MVIEKLPILNLNNLFPGNGTRVCLLGPMVVRVFVTPGLIPTICCNECDMISTRGQIGAIEVRDSQESREFRRPGDIDAEWHEIGCNEFNATSLIQDCEFNRLIL